MNTVESDVCVRVLRRGYLNGAEGEVLFQKYIKIEFKKNIIIVNWLWNLFIVLVTFFRYTCISIIMYMCVFISVCMGVGEIVRVKLLPCIRHCDTIPESFFTVIQENTIRKIMKNKSCMATFIGIQLHDLAYVDKITETQ